MSHQQQTDNSHSEMGWTPAFAQRRTHKRLRQRAKEDTKFHVRLDAVAPPPVDRTSGLAATLQTNWYYDLPEDVLYQIARRAAAAHLHDLVQSGDLCRLDGASDDRWRRLARYLAPELQHGCDELVDAIHSRWYAKHGEYHDEYHDEHDPTSERDDDGHEIDRHWARAAWNLDASEDRLRRARRVILQNGGPSWYDLGPSWYNQPEPPSPTWSPRSSASYGWYEDSEPPSPRSSASSFSFDSGWYDEPPSPRSYVPPSFAELRATWSEARRRAERAEARRVKARRVAWVHTLGKLEPAALAQHGAALVARLLDSDWEVRQAAVETLGKLEAAALAQHGAALVARLLDSDENVCYAAVETLGKLKPAALAQHGAALVAMASWPRRCRLLDTEWRVREAAWELLTKLGAEETLAQHVAVIVARLEHSDWHVRRAAVETLGRLEPAALAQHGAALVAELVDSVRYVLAKVALEGEDEDVRAAARRVLRALAAAVAAASDAPPLSGRRVGRGLIGRGAVDLEGACVKEARDKKLWRDATKRRGRRQGSAGSGGGVEAAPAAVPRATPRERRVTRVKRHAELSSHGRRVHRKR